MTRFMEHRDYRGHGTLRIHRPLRIEMTGVMEHCDESGNGSL